MSNPQIAPGTGPTASGPRRLTRRRDDRMITGVCGGVARYLNIDATLVRVLTVLAFVFSGFFPVGLLYLVAWVLMPQE